MWTVSLWFDDGEEKLSIITVETHLQYKYCEQILLLLLFVCLHAATENLYPTLS